MYTLSLCTYIYIFIESIIYNLKSIAYCISIYIYLYLPILISISISASTTIIYTRTHTCIYVYRFVLKLLVRNWCSKGVQSAALRFLKTARMIIPVPLKPRQRKCPSLLMKMPTWNHQKQCLFHLCNGRSRQLHWCSLSQLVDHSLRR